MRLLMAAAAALLVPSAAFAGDDVMSSTYGNTVIAKTPMMESHAHYKADHTVTADVASPMGSMTLTGTWKIDDQGKLCRSYTNAPPMMPNPFCVPWTPHKVGDSWQATMNGRTSNVTIVAGIQ
jgi:hypothetical protein